MIKLLRNTMSAGSLPLSSSQKLKHYALIGGTGRSGLVDNLPTCGMAQKLLLLLGQFVCHEKKLRKSKKFESTVFSSNNFGTETKIGLRGKFWRREKKLEKLMNAKICIFVSKLDFYFLVFSSLLPTQDVFQL